MGRNLGSFIAVQFQYFPSSSMWRNVYLIPACRGLFFIRKWETIGGRRRVKDFLLEGIREPKAKPTPSTVGKYSLKHGWMALSFFGKEKVNCSLELLIARERAVKGRSLSTC